MVRRTRTALSLVAALLISVRAAPGFAQSLSVEEEKPAEPPPTPTPAPASPKPAPVIVMPSPVSTPLEYPQGATGEAVVVLELTLSAGGDVTQATAMEGSEPFSARAIEAA